MPSLPAITEFDPTSDDHRHPDLIPHALDDPTCCAAPQQQQTPSLLMSHVDDSLHALNFAVDAAAVAASSQDATTTSSSSFYPTTPTTLHNSLASSIDWSQGYYHQHLTTPPPSTCSSSPALPLPSPNTMVNGPQQKGGARRRSRKAAAADAEEQQQQQHMMPSIDVRSPPAGELPYIDERAFQPPSQQLAALMNSPTNPGQHQQQESLSVPTPILGHGPGASSLMSSPTSAFDPQLASEDQIRQGGGGGGGGGYLVPADQHQAGSSYASSSSGGLSLSPSMIMSTTSSSAPPQWLSGPPPPPQWPHAASAPPQQHDGPGSDMSASMMMPGPHPGSFVQTPLEYSRRNSLDQGAAYETHSDSVGYSHLAPGPASSHPYERGHSGSSRSRGSSRSSTMAHSRLGWSGSREGTTEASSASSGAGVGGGYIASPHDPRQVVGYVEVPSVAQPGAHADPYQQGRAYENEGDYRDAQYHGGLSTSSSLPSLSAAYYHSSGATTFVPSPQMPQNEWRPSSQASSAMLSPVSPGAPFFSPQLAPPPFLRRHTSETAFPLSAGGMHHGGGQWTGDVPLMYDQARFGGMPYPPPSPYVTFAGGNTSAGGSSSMPRLRRANSGPSRPATSPTRSATSGVSKMIIACRECRRECCRVPGKRSS